VENLGAAFVKLLLAHILADFFLQPGAWVRQKWEKEIWSRYFWMHIGMVGLVSYVLFMRWSLWQLPLIIMLGHGLIDIIKIWIGKDTSRAFIVDQIAHLLFIYLVCTLWSGNVDILMIKMERMAEDAKMWTIMTGYLFMTLPLSVLIRYLVNPWAREVGEKGISQANRGLQNAGKYIGILERVLIFTFILLNEFRAIGFLLAAKSVFRFGDLKDSTDRKKTEYILLGTLISFACAILSGLLFKSILISV